ncbi:hypothetical protein BS47DRAFT_219363 [Hydnum rufescens UP504]|uniref:Secreted protein n=1 Tax=Hydnum rufescens UP504 TaxID=1448309 RepID=A0A9P6AMI2_9AGAM|nr:hypothetical protein BS47DRAFT_219363 [Hydnum rufescens UP504]
MLRRLSFPVSLLLPLGQLKHGTCRQDFNYTPPNVRLLSNHRLHLCSCQLAACAIAEALAPPVYNWGAVPMSAMPDTMVYPISAMNFYILRVDGVSSLRKAGRAHRCWI